MSQPNAISVVIPESDLTEIRAAIATLSTKLMPHLKSLSVQDRSELPKMGEKTVHFVQKALEYGQRNKELVPAFLDLPAMAVDVQAVHSLRELAQGLNPMTDAINDSMMLSGSEAYQGALLLYNHVKIAAKAKAPNAGTIYDDLSSRFPGRAANKKV
ncbi:MAG: hypothetical protein A2Z96_07140 [Spirochaetes bacterium GWB1_48_6]|nr:MAG: hypothetical protein A2Z96_07140 [Spirochaetes bacterium GWB1_48_6]